MRKVEVPYIFLCIIKPINIVLSIILMAVAFLFDQVFDLFRKRNSFIYKTLDFV